MAVDVSPSIQGVVPALGELPSFKAGDQVRISTRMPIGHYRVPAYLRGKVVTVQSVIPTMAVDNEEESFGRNAGSKGHYYRVAIPMSEIWQHYESPSEDELLIEIFENWLEKV